MTAASYIFAKPRPPSPQRCALRVAIALRSLKKHKFYGLSGDPTPSISIATLPSKSYLAASGLVRSTESGGKVAPVSGTPLIGLVSWGPSDATLA